PSGASMPSFPNYRLGPLGQPGLPCSPLAVGTEAPPSPLPALSVFPNPAGAWLQVIANQPLPAGARWTLSDALGRTLRSEPVAADGQCLEVPLEGLAAGVYFWVLRSGAGDVVQEGKVLKR
ncbi:MAG: T9SS type A sorting domain-containing protein, partial [Saprospiraceae bacterium]|nr:T9SS type A sorting domain-containing protein [Saprospiraceae bacterium]